MSVRPNVKIFGKSEYFAVFPDIGVKGGGGLLKNIFWE